jgi:hypothetical protein
MTSLFESSTNKKIWNFSPVIIPGCVLWLDASDPNTVTMSGANVTNWKDKSIIPAANKVGGDTGLRFTGTSPTLATQNGLNTIAFGGAGTLSTTSNISTLPTGNASGTYFVVARTAANSAVVQMMFEYGGATREAARTIRGFYFRGAAGPDNSVPVIDVGTGSDRCVASNAQYTSGDYTIISSIQTRTPGADLDYFGFINGADFAIQAAQESGVVTGSSEFNIGGGSLPSGGGTIGYYLTGNVAEILIYNRALNAADSYIVEGYLARKWGLTNKIVSNSHPYRAGSIPTAPYLTLFSPTDISGCCAWFDASDMSTFTMSGANVTNWIDKSPITIANKLGGVLGLRCLTAPFPTLQQLNGLNTIQFNSDINFGSTVGLGSSTTPLGNSAGTYFVVGRTTVATANPQIIFAYGDRNAVSTGSHRQFYFTTDVTAVRTDITNTGLTETDVRAGSKQYTLGNYTIISSVQALSGSTLTNTSYIDGVAFYTNNTPTTQANVGTGSFRVGSIEPGPPYNSLTGNVAEILIYNVALSDADRLKVEGYLSWKWGLQRATPSIPQSHSFYNFPPATVTP